MHYGWDIHYFNKEKLAMMDIDIMFFGSNFSVMLDCLKAGDQVVILSMSSLGYDDEQIMERLIQFDRKKVMLKIMDETDSYVFNPREMVNMYAEWKSYDLLHHEVMMHTTMKHENKEYQ